jgi:type IV pilus assembly protein PilW
MTCKNPIQSMPHRLGSLLQKGFTLIELMVAIALGLVVIAAVMQGFAASTSTSGTNASVAEAGTNGRHALEVLKRETRHASLHRLVWDKSQMNTDAALAIKNYGCGAGMVDQLFIGITGFNDTNPFSENCLGTTAKIQYARGDVMLLRRTELQPSSAFDENAPYVRVSYGAAASFLGAGTATAAPDYPEPRFDYRLTSDVYFVNAFTNSSNESPMVPALYRLGLSSGANPSMTATLVASNVEHFQIQFGVVDASGNMQYVNPSATLDWAGVRTARLWLLVRESKPEPGLVSGSYVLGNVTYTPNDKYRRTVQTTTIALRNNS